MRTLSLKDLIPETVHAYGALDFDQRGQGISPRRLPAWTRIQLPLRTDVMVRMPAGVRLRFETDSSRLGLRFLATNMVTPPDERRPVTFSLEVGGRLLRADSKLGRKALEATVGGEALTHRWTPSGSFPSAVAAARTASSSS